MSEAAVCVRCGRGAEFDFEAFWLCLDCYHAAGSTCAGIGSGPDDADRQPEPTC